MNILLKFKDVFNSLQKRNIHIIIALLPLLLFGFILFGIKAFLVCFVCVASTVVFDYFVNLLLKNGLTDYSNSIVSGLFLGLMLPPTLPLYITVLGSAFSVFVVKLFLTSKNGFAVSPALVSRVFLQLSFPKQMSLFLEPMVDVEASATPLTHNIYNFKEVLFGVTSGSIGETSTILIILCGLYLIWVKVVSFEIPLSFILSALVSTLIFGQSSVVTILLGSLIFTSFFMGVEGINQPKNRLGKILFGIGCGVLTVIIRDFGNIAEGTSYAVVFMSLIVPLIDKIKFGVRKVESSNEI